MTLQAGAEKPSTCGGEVDAPVFARTSSLHDRIAGASLVVSSIAFVLLQAWPGTIQFTDELIFKAAGANWALHGRFAAPEIAGRLHFDPPITQIFGAYPPLYPMLFGLWFRVAGFGAAQSAVFDGLVHVGLCWLTRAAMLRFVRGRGSWFASAVAIVMLPAGVVGRPDDLAVCLGLIAGLAAASPWTLRNALISGAFWGLCLGTSPAAFMSLLIGTFVFYGPPMLAVTWGFRLKWIGVATVALVVAQSAVWGPILWVNHRAFLQVFEHAANASLQQSIWQSFQWAWQFVRPSIALTLAGAVCWVIVFAAVLANRGVRFAFGLCAAPVLAVFFISLAHNPLYLWMPLPMLMVAVLALLVELAPPVSRTLAVVCFVILLAGSLAASASYIVNTLALAELPESQTLTFNGKLLRELIPKGSTVLLTDHWYTIGGDYHIIDASVSGVDELLKSEYVVLTANFSGIAGHRRILSPKEEEVLRQKFTLIHSNLPSGVLTLFGVHLSRSSRGFGTVVYERNDLLNRPTAPPTALPPGR